MTANATPITLRASMAPLWLQCPRQAEHRMRQKRSTSRVGEPVARVLGSRVHHKITGDRFEAPDSIMFDRLTPSARELDRQVDATAALTERALRDYRVVEKELPLEVDVKLGDVLVSVRARVDLVAEHPDGGRIYLDVKTGHYGHREALVQMSLAAWLGFQYEDDVREVILILAPRGRKEWETLRRPAKELAGEAMGFIKHVSRAVEHPLARPGDHCKRCDNRACIFNHRYDTR